MIIIFNCCVLRNYVFNEKWNRKLRENKNNLKQNEIRGKEKKTTPYFNARAQSLSVLFTHRLFSNLRCQRCRHRHRSNTFSFYSIFYFAFFLLLPFVYFLLRVHIRLLSVQFTIGRFDCKNNDMKNKSKHSKNERVYFKWYTIDTFFYLCCIVEGNW